MVSIMDSKKYFNWLDSTPCDGKGTTMSIGLTDTNLAGPYADCDVLEFINGNHHSKSINAEGGSGEQTPVKLRPANGAVIDVAGDNGGLTDRSIVIFDDGWFDIRGFNDPIVSTPDFTVGGQSSDSTIKKQSAGTNHGLVLVNLKIEDSFFASVMAKTDNDPAAVWKLVHVENVWGINSTTGEFVYIGNTQFTGQHLIEKAVVRKCIIQEYGRDPLQFSHVLNCQASQILAYKWGLEDLAFQGRGVQWMDSAGTLQNAVFFGGTLAKNFVAWQSGQFNMYDVFFEGKQDDAQVSTVFAIEDQVAEHTSNDVISEWGTAQRPVYVRDIQAVDRIVESNRTGGTLNGYFMVDKALQNLQTLNNTGTIVINLTFDFSKYLPPAEWVVDGAGRRKIRVGTFWASLISSDLTAGTAPATLTFVSSETGAISNQIIVVKYSENLDFVPDLDISNVSATIDAVAATINQIETHYDELYIHIDELLSPGDVIRVTVSAEKTGTFNGVSSPLVDDVLVTDNLQPPHLGVGGIIESWDSGNAADFDTTTDFIWMGAKNGSILRQTTEAQKPTLISNVPVFDNIDDNLLLDENISISGDCTVICGTIHDGGSETDLFRTENNDFEFTITPGEAFRFRINDINYNTPNNTVEENERTLLIARRIDAGGGLFDLELKVISSTVDTTFNFSGVDGTDILFEKLGITTSSTPNDEVFHAQIIDRALTDNELTSVIDDLKTKYSI